MRWIFWSLILANVLVFVGSITLRLIGRGEGPDSVAEAPTRSGFIAEARRPAVERSEHPSPSPAARMPLCTFVGPFDTRHQADDLIARLKAWDLRANIHNIELSEGPGYWVYLAPMASREAARRYLAELQARGVDSYLIPRGDLENGISVGVYSRLDLAEARIRDLTRQNLAPKMREIERTYRELWVMLPPDEVQKLARSVWRGLIDETFSLQEKQNFCLDVASAGNIH